MGNRKRQQWEMDHPIQAWRERLSRISGGNPSLDQARAELDKWSRRGYRPAEVDDMDGDPESGAAMDDAGL